MVTFVATFNVSTLKLPFLFSWINNTHALTIYVTNCVSSGELNVNATCSSIRNASGGGKEKVEKWPKRN